MKKIILCGMMGSGKTTVANILRNKYGYKCVDTDERIVQKYGSINDIFHRHGEKRFRDIESKVTVRVANSRHNYVISLGGGCVLRPSNVEALKRVGTIFYLRTSPKIIVSRLEGDTSRPLLHGNLEERVKSITATRSSVYETVADVIIDTDDLNPEQIAKIIVNNVEGQFKNENCVNYRRNKGNR
ncbi:MAG TPA: shikimate kinase [Candidatus Coproplasma excrementipullorum]|nr:shikimate kinase [Candidatus Coproplasma excrementipullorum]